MTRPSFRLRMARGPRDLARFPRAPLRAGEGDGAAADDALGEGVFAAVLDALRRGLPRPALLAFFAEEVEQVDIAPLASADPAHRERMLAALAGGRPGVEAVALVGVLQVRSGRAGGRAAVAFVEWPDNRWWTAWRFIDEARRPLGEAAVVRRAVDGWPRPNGVGGWFARARREQLRLNRRPLGGAQEGLGLVH